MSSIFDSILCWLVLIFRYIKWIIYKIIASGLWVYLPTICNIFSCLLGESGPSLPGSGPSLPGSDHYQGMPMEGPPGDLENLGGKSTSLQAIHDIPLMVLLRVRRQAHHEDSMPFKMLLHRITLLHLITLLFLRLLHLITLLFLSLLHPITLLSTLHLIMLSGFILQ